MSQVFFVVNNLLAVLITVLASEILMKEREPWRRLLAVVAGFPVVVLAVVLILGNVGLLSAGAAAILLGLGVLVLSAVYNRRTPKVNDRIVDKSIGDKRKPATRVAWILTIALLGGLVGLMVGGVLLHGIKFSWDDLTYHAPVAAHWLVNGRLSLASFGYSAYYPFNGEIFSLWFMLPFTQDGQASLAGLYWLGLTVMAAVSLGRSQGYSKWILLVSGVLVSASPVIQISARTFSSVDLAGAALLLTAVAFALPCVNARPCDRIVDAAYCGLISGLAIGCKISFAPISVILLLWFIFGQRLQTTKSIRFQSALIFILSACATGAYWYVRNIILTGNPLFPAEIGPFDGPLMTEMQNRTKIISWIVAEPKNWQQWLYLFKSHIKWPVTFFVLCVLGYGVSFYSLVFSRSPKKPNESSMNFLLLTVGLTLMVLYPLMPFAGTPNHPEAKLFIRLRFVIGPFLVGLVLFIKLMEGSHWNRWFWRGMAAVITIAIFDEHGRFYAQNAVTHGTILAFGSAMVYLCGKYGMQIKQQPIQWMVIFGFLPTALATLALCAPYQQRLTDRGIHTYGDEQRPIGSAWQALETLPPGVRIAWFGTSAYQYYPVFGRQFQFIPFAVDIDGKPYQPLHERWQRDRKNTIWWKKKESEISKLVDNLTFSGAEYILVTKWNLYDWPEQQDVLAEWDKAKQVYNDGYSVIWKIQE